LTSAVGRDYRGWVLLSWDSEKRILKDGFYTYKEGEGRGSCDKGVCEIFTLLSGLLGGIGLAGGFELFRFIKEKIASRKNNKYMSDLEEACCSQTVL